MFFMILREPHVEETYGSSVIVQNAFNKSHCRILLSSISVKESINNFFNVKSFCIEIIVKESSISD